MPISLLSYHWEKNPISNKIFRILLAKIPLKWKSEIGQSTGDRDFKRESSPVLAFYKVFEPAPNKREPLHCRLRRSIGFLNVQKQMVVSHSRNSKIWQFCTFCEDYDPNFVPKKFHNFFRKQIWSESWSMFRIGWRGPQRRLIFGMVKI